MLDSYTRTAILRLSQEGHGARTIARAFSSLSRNAVREVIRGVSSRCLRWSATSAWVSPWTWCALPYDDCKGNLVRVMEKPAERGLAIGYSTLTAFCRRHEIGRKPKLVAGQYHFEPGQRDAARYFAHAVRIGERKVTLQGRPIRGSIPTHEFRAPPACV